MIGSAWDRLDDIERELEWRKCVEGLTGFIYFCANYVAIKVPGKGQIPLDLRAAQIETARIWMNDRFSVTLKARQIGFSTLAAALSLWHVMFHDDREIIMLSITGADATKLLGIARYAWKALPPDMRLRAGKLTKDTRDALELDNGSSIKSLNSSNPARGYTAYAIFVDEFSAYEKADEAWAAIEPAADIGGRIHVLSTARGVGNAFHEMWVRASTGVSDYVPIFYAWDVVPERDDVWYQRQKNSKPEWQLHQEYPSSPEEAFIKSGRPVFDSDLIRAIELGCSTPEHVGYLEEGRFVEVLDGELQVWRWAQSGHKYVVGADVAEGLEFGDFSVAYVLDCVDGEIVAKWRGHIDPDTFGGTTLYDLGTAYLKALIGPEVNNHGYTTCQALKNRRYGRIYRRKQRDERVDRNTARLGWSTDRSTKRLMIDELRQSLRDGDLKVRDKDTLGQLRTFVRDTDGKMHGSPWDDDVMALAITNQMRSHWAERGEDSLAPLPGTWGFQEDHVASKRVEGRPSWQLGTHNVR